MEKITKIILGVVVAAFLGVAVWAFMQSTNKSDTDFKSYDETKIIGANKDNGNIGDNARGNLDSNVVIVEYADFECPGCATASGRMDTVYEKYKDKVAFVFRNFPIHTYANVAAAAAESAGRQGKFWEMASKLFENQAEWSDEDMSSQDRLKMFNTYFAAVCPEGNITKFENDMSSQNISKKISFDKKIAEEKSDITETPAFYINGEKFNLEDVNDDDDFVKKMSDAIDRALKK